VPRSRNNKRGLAGVAGRLGRAAVLLGRAAALLGRAAVLLLWAQVARRPIDSAAIFAAAAGSLVIVVNALLLQSRSLPAPVPVATAPRPSVNPPKSLHVPAPAAAPARGVGLAGKPAHAATAPRHDAIAELIDQGAQVVAVQRALADYGYGQLKPSGILDPPTRGAIERFEREHHIPVTGKISDRMLDELAVLIGHPLE